MKRAGWLLFLRCSGILDTFSHFDPRAGFHTGVRYFFDKEEPSAAAFGCTPNTNHIMEQMLICLSLALIAGLLMSRAAKAVRLPAVTAYLLTGLLMGPFFLGRLGLSRFGFGFGSLAAVEGYGILTQVALGFIAFVIGNEFRLSALKHMGRRAVTVGVAQAVITTALVDIALVALHFARPDVISLASAITLGSIAAATAPAATLMVVKQYKADGPLTKLLLMVVAIDDAVGLVLFSASYGVANALEQGRIDPMSVVLEPLLEIALSLALGAAAGYLLNLLEVYFHSRSKRMSLSVAFVLLTVGLSMTKFEINGTRCGFSLLLVCMMTGTVFCNVCPTSDELMDRLDRWVSPINILFFVLSGAELDLTILTNPMVLLIGVVYIVARSAGKISGSYLSCRATSCSPAIQKYLGYHPAAAGRRGAGHGCYRCRVVGRPHGAQRGAVLGAGVRAGRPHPDQDLADRRRRDPSRGSHQRPRGEPARSPCGAELRRRERIICNLGVLKSLQAFQNPFFHGENLPHLYMQKVFFCRIRTQSLTKGVIFCILSLSALAQFSYCVSGC
mgnify:CR=1 FL=1